MSINTSSYKNALANLISIVARNNSIIFKVLGYKDSPFLNVAPKAANNSPSIPSAYLYAPIPSSFSAFSLFNPIIRAGMELWANSEGEITGGDGGVDWYSISYVF